MAIGERSMLLAEIISAADKPEARHLAEFEYPAGTSPQEPQALGEALGEFLRQKQFTARQAVVGLPAKWLLVKTKEVPPADSKTASDMLRLQAEGDFSSELRDLVFDYAGESNPAQTQNVLLVATPRKYIELAEKLCEAAKLNAIAVTSSAAALGAVTSRAPAARNAVVLALTTGSAEISAQSGGHPMSLRHLRSPGAGGQEALFLSELRRAVSMLPSNGSSTGREMIVWDGAGAEEALGQNLGMPVRFGDLPSLGIRTVDSARNGEGRKYGAAVALGLAAIGPDRLPVDFLHSRLAPPPERVVKPWMMWTGIAVLVAIVVGVLGYLALNSMQNELSTLNSQYTAKEPHIKSATAFVNTVKFAERWEPNDPRYLACLKALTEVFPEDGQTYVTSLTIKEKVLPKPVPGKPAPIAGLSITLIGNAPTQARAQELYQKVLDKPQYFAEADLKHIVTGQNQNFGRGRGSEAAETTFTLTCTYRVQDASSKPTK